MVSATVQPNPKPRAQQVSMTRWFSWTWGFERELDPSWTAQDPTLALAACVCLLVARLGIW